MFFQNTLRFNQAIIITMMGVGGLLMALVTGNFYKQLALDNQRINMYNLLEYKTHEEIDELSVVVNDLGLSLQSHPGFRSAFKTGVQAEITLQLNNQFRQYFVTAGILDLAKLFVFDKHFKYIAGSKDGDAYQKSGELPCSQIIQQASQRKGSDRLRVLNDICMYESIPFHVAILPIGGLVPKGFLMVVSRLLHTFKDIEKAFDMPVRILKEDGMVLYDYDLWSKHTGHNEDLEAEYILKSKNNNEIVRVRILDDMKVLKQKLSAARTKIIIFASVVTAIAMLIAFLILNRSVLLPMKTMLTQLKRIQVDRSNLGQKIEVKGSQDMQELANGFNGMSEDLDVLYQSLAKMAFTDPLTTLHNRAWFHKQLRRCINIGERHKNPFTIFVMDLNKFKPINDNYGHHVGDMILEEVSKRMKEVLRGEDILVRLNNDQTEDSNNKVIARIGGDEFAVLLPMMGDRDNVETVAKKLIEAIKQPIEIEENSFVIGMSIGIAMYPQQGNDGDHLLRKADEAMYLAKNNGSDYKFSNGN